MVKRFFRDRLYLFRGKRFDSFSHTTVSYECVVLGAFVGTRATKRDCVGEFIPDGRVYRIEEGHLPDWQPRVVADQLAREMARGPFPVAVPV